MSIVRMKRLRLIALEEQRDELLAQLQHLGCVEISEPGDKLADPDWMALLGRGSSSLGQVKAETSAVEAALSALKKYAPAKTGLFRVREQISEAELFSAQREQEAMAHVQAINDAVSELARLESQESRLMALRDSLRPWQTLDLPLEQERTQYTEILLGTLPAAESVEEIRGVLAEQAPLCEMLEVSRDEDLHYVFFLCHQDQWPQAQEVLKPYTFSTVRFKELTGTAQENLQAVEAQLDQIYQDQQGQEAEIRRHADAREGLEILTDRLNQDAQREAARERALTDGTIFFLEGWVAVPKLDKVRKVLHEYDLAYYLRDPVEGDDVPTLLDNPKWMKPINMVTEMYSPPAYDGIDPNPLIFGWYIFFFGFMFADVAYGLIIWLVCEFVIRKVKPKGTMFYLGRYLGLSTAFCGIFTGGFFGNAISVVAENFFGIAENQLPGWLQAFNSGLVVNPINDPLSVLVLSLGLGFVHLVMGQCIHIYMEARDGHLLSGLLDVVPWWIFFAGIGVFVLANTPAVLFASLVILVLTQGHNEKGIFAKLFGGVSSLYDVTSWLSDILSYARLMALMLATSVIAMVFNTLAALPQMLLAFVVIFLIGHTFNIGVNLIGTYVHAARLQYLEYYGKFYKDGGRFFKPLQYKTKFVDLNEEEN